MKGLERYYAFIADFGQHVLDPIAKKRRDPSDLTDKETRLFDSIFRRFAEISDALENLGP